MGTAAPAMKSALLAACRDIYDAPVFVCMGHPGTNMPDDIVSVGNVTSSLDIGPLAPTRTREEHLDVEVTFSVYRGGSDQETVTNRAYELLGLLEAYLTDAGTASSSQLTLGGVVRRAWVNGHVLAESTGETVAQGRVAEITAVVTANARIT